MSIVAVREAETHFCRPPARVEQGEDVLISRAGKPVARLVPVAEPPVRRFGVMDLHVRDAASESLAEAELAAWE